VKTNKKKNKRKDSLERRQITMKKGSEKQIDGSNRAVLREENGRKATRRKASISC
jgi:hypothetical protein